MDQKKRKRMISNRESARRSRIRRQQHVDDLTAQVDQLSEQNSYIFRNVKATTQLYMNLETENSVLRAQVAELTQRLNSLNEFVECLNSNNNWVLEGTTDQDVDQMMMNGTDDFFLDTWNLTCVNQVPIMATPGDMFMV